MFRLFDWRCPDCGNVSEGLVSVPTGEIPPLYTEDLICPKCDRTGLDRAISMPAKYTGERAASPIVSGGKYDTIGNREPPPLPEFNGQTFDDFKEHVNTKEYKEVHEKRRAVAKENKAKRKRYQASKRDPNLNFRQHRLAGDPKM